VIPSPPITTPSNDEEVAETAEESYELCRIVPLEKPLGNPVKYNDLDLDHRPQEVVLLHYGWPLKAEFPVDYLEPEHLQTIAIKRSQKVESSNSDVQLTLCHSSPKFSTAPQGDCCFAGSGCKKEGVDREEAVGCFHSPSRKMAGRRQKDGSEPHHRKEERS